MSGESLRQGGLLAPASVLLVVGTMMASGCGGSASKPTATVEGTVTHNGDPVSEGRLMFAPTAEGGVDQKVGKPKVFSVGSDGKYSGRAVLGKNRVRYTPPAPERGEKVEGHAEVEEPEPSPYEGLAAQPETVEITEEEPNSVDVKLVPASGG